MADPIDPFNQDRPHHPNQTITSLNDPNLPPGVPALPRDPSQPIHKRPRVFLHRPLEDPNDPKSAYQNTSYLTALRTLPLSDFLQLHEKPCVRDAMLPGIGAGSGIGVLRFVLGASVSTSCIWAVASTNLVGVAGYEWCQRKRRIEKDRIRQAVKVLEQRQREKEAEEEAAARRLEEDSKATREQRTRKAGFWGALKFW